MKSKGRIGVIMAHVVPPMDNELLGGIADAISQHGYDTVLITGIQNILNETYPDGYCDGLENIYSLLNYANLDGVIFAADRFLHDKIRKQILDTLIKRRFPSILIEHKYQGLDHVYAPQKEYIKAVTSHLINEHKCRKLYCISGFEGEPNSMERIEGFREALESEGLEFSENNVFYGHFWRDIPCSIADDIADGRLEMPDGVVCANDEMATAFCGRLKKRGIRVPQDIAVTGYDGNIDGFFNDPSITTVTGHDYQLGSMAAVRLLEKLGHFTGGVPEYRQHIRYGTSCGCEEKLNTVYQPENRYMLRNIQKTNKMHAERRDYIAADMISKLSVCGNIYELMLETAKLSYLLPNWKTLEICMCDDWCFDFDSPEKYRTTGFSENMKHMCYLIKGDTAGRTEDFHISRLLPSFDIPHDPMIYVISPMHHKKQVFGYIGTSYDYSDDFLLDEYYVNWCDCVSNGFDIIQNQLYKNYVKQHFASLLTVDTHTGLYNKRGLMENIVPFITKCGKTGRKCAAVMMSYETNTEHYEVSPLLAMTNIFRNNEFEDILAARPEDDVIACIVASDSQKENDVLEKFMKFVDQQMKRFYGGAIQFDISKIASCCGFLSENNLGSTESELEKLIEKAADKAKVMTFDVSDCSSHLQNARRRILESPQLDWNVDDIAREAGISKSYFQRLYRETFGTSCMEDIINARIDRAKRLLENTDLQIGDIAVECGYSNGSHFMRQFRQKTGVTALEYRKDSRK